MRECNDAMSCRAEDGTGALRWLQQIPGGCVDGAVSSVCWMFGCEVADLSVKGEQQRRSERGSKHRLWISMRQQSASEQQRHCRLRRDVLVKEIGRRRVR